MLKTVQAVLDKEGRVQFLEPVSVEKPVRVLITFLEEEPSEVSSALLSEAALEDWNRPEEDEAWKHLQREP